MNNSTQDTVNSCQPFALPFWRRLTLKLFPKTQCPRPESPDFASVGMLIQRSQVTVTWDDRIRILLSGKILLETMTSTEFDVGRTTSVGVMSVPPPRWWPRFFKKR